MIQIHRLKLLFSLAVLFSISLASNWIQPSVAAISNPSRSFLSKNCSVRSDFDGDQRPDLATGKAVGLLYEIIIQFGDREEKLSFSRPKNNSEIIFLTSDVDQDGDQDLVIFDGDSLQPLLVWINDGHGHFVKDTTWWCANSVRNDPPSANDHIANHSDRGFNNRGCSSSFGGHDFNSLPHKVHTQKIISSRYLIVTSQILKRKSTFNNLTARSPPSQLATTAV